MSKICLFLRKKSIKGNTVSKSNSKKKRKFLINCKNIRIWNSYYFKKVKLSTQSIKILKKCLF